MEDNNNIFLDAPNARWETVVAYAAENRSLPLSPDRRWLRTGVRFLQRWKTSTRAQLHQLEREYGPLFRAHLLYDNIHSERWIIEAGLLTRDATIPDIAKYIGQDQSVVEMYQLYFFDIRTKLQAEGFITTQLLSPAFGSGLHMGDPDALYKALAYVKGWKLFCELISHATSSEEALEFLRRDFETGLLKLGWAATKFVTPNNYNAVELLQTVLKMKEIDKEDTMKIAGGEALSSLNSLLAHCKTSILPSKEPMKVLAEPRTSELLGAPKGLKYGEPIPVGEAK